MLKKQSEWIIGRVNELGNYIRIDKELIIPSILLFFTMGMFLGYFKEHFLIGFLLIFVFVIFHGPVWGLVWAVGLFVGLSIYIIKFIL